MPNVYLTHTSFINPRYFNSGLMNSTTIGQAISYVNGSKRTFYLEPGTWSITDDLIIPAYITLLCDIGTILTVSAGKTLTISGYIIAGPYQIFYGSGTTAVSTYPQERAWWGLSQRTDFTALTIGGVAPGFGDMDNPMTAQGDMVYGDDDGTPLSLPIGGPGQILTVNGSGDTPEWQTAAGILSKVISVTAAVFQGTQDISSSTWTSITNLAVTITPKSTNSKFLLAAVVNYGSNASAYVSGIKFVSNSSDIVSPTSPGSRGQFHGALNPSGVQMHTVTAMIPYAPSTITEQVFEVQAYCYTQALWINKSGTDTDNANFSRGVSSFVVVEYES
jgi:hypothetical protein